MPETKGRVEATSVRVGGGLGEKRILGATEGREP